MNFRSRTIVFVHGMFGWGPGELPIGHWGAALAQFDARRFAVHEVKCGPVSSHHDRACELFAQINGGDVDYGARHSEAAGHARFVKDEARPYAKKGLIDEWSAENPVILVGHSAGAHSCLKLQQLLAEDFWGVGSSADWVEAVVSIAGVLNGSLLPYRFGCDPVTGLLTGNPKRLIGATLQVANIATGFSSSGIELWLDHWSDLDRFVENTDNLAYDLTLKGCREANAAFRTHPNTCYLSLVSGMKPSPLKIPFTSIAMPFSPESWAGMNLFLRDGASWQYRKCAFSEAAPPLPEWETTPLLSLDAWRENDGAVSAISQLYPFTAREEPHAEGVFGDAPLEKGKWRFERIENVAGRPFDHLDPVFGPLLRSDAMNAHKRLYRRLNERLGGGVQGPTQKRAGH